MLHPTSEKNKNYKNFPSHEPNDTWEDVRTSKTHPDSCVSCKCVNVELLFFLDPCPPCPQLKQKLKSFEEGNVVNRELSENSDTEVLGVNWFIALTLLAPTSPWLRLLHFHFPCLFFFFFRLRGEVYSSVSKHEKKWKERFGFFHIESKTYSIKY